MLKLLLSVVNKTNNTFLYYKQVCHFFVKQNIDHRYLKKKITNSLKQTRYLDQFLDAQ